MNRRTVVLMLAGVMTLTVGCEKQPAAPRATIAPPGVTIPASLFLAAAPPGAQDVKAAKAEAKAGQPIVISGRIGGSVDPFVEGRAVFTLMDPALPACSDKPEESCATPWDYCCEPKDQIAAHAATVQLVDADGRPLKVGLKGQHGLKELSRLVVAGTVAQADGNLLVINASGIYVKGE